MRAVSKMRRHGRAAFDGAVKLLRSRSRMPNASHHTFARHCFDEMIRARPFG